MDRPATARVQIDGPVSRDPIKRYSRRQAAVSFGGTSDLYGQGSALPEVRQHPREAGLPAREAGPSEPRPGDEPDDRGAEIVVRRFAT